jgi:hypothetical protein
VHIQIVHFQLNGIDEALYRQACDQEAPAFAALPGLVSKVWLADPSTNTYGGVYTWRDRKAMQDFLKSELFSEISADPQLKNFTSRDFSILQAPTEVTQGVPFARA